MISVVFYYFDLVEPDVIMTYLYLQSIAISFAPRFGVMVLIIEFNLCAIDARGYYDLNEKYVRKA